MSKCRDCHYCKKTYRDRISTFQAPFHYCLVQEKMVKLSYGCEHFKTKKIEYDLEYVEKMSLWLDIKLVFETVVQVFKKTNAEISEKGIKEEIKELKEQKAYSKVV